jgi:hypothetical protein
LLEAYKKWREVCHSLCLCICCQTSASIHSKIRWLLFTSTRNRIQGLKQWGPFVPIYLAYTLLLSSSHIVWSHQQFFSRMNLTRNLFRILWREI